MGRFVSPPRSSSFSKLSSVSRSDQVRDQLEAAIRRGDYAPGDRLPSERELTEMLGVSRVSVREGIRSLEAIGLVQVRHGNGCFVLDPASLANRELSRWLELHRDEALELLRVRGALDEVAAEEAAVRRDPEAMRQVHEAHEAFLAEVARRPRPRVETLADLDVDFHLSIARASGSQLLVNLLGELHLHLGESRKAAFEARGRPRQAVSEHEAILEALDAGDGAAARAAVSAHIGHVRRLLARRRVEA